jgi:hypothetical protein
VMARKITISRSHADLFEVLSPLLIAMYEEFSELSKRKPEGVLNKQKVLTVNRLLKKCKQLMEREPALEFLDELDEVSMPQNSDVVLSLSQYVAAMKQFRVAHTHSDSLGSRDWNIPKS